FSVFLQVSARPRASLLFPYTTLFRSAPFDAEHAQFLADPRIHRRRRQRVRAGPADRVVLQRDRRKEHAGLQRAAPCAGRYRTPRSEEHTSELQSHLNLVCRLLLEKKK